MSSSEYGSGIKWSFEQLRVYCRDNALPYEQMWVKIESILLLTCVNYCALVPDNKSCFELLGFDVMIDANMKPWLIEVNSSPQMSMDGYIDSLVKPPLIRDMINLCNFVPAGAYVGHQPKRPDVRAKPQKPTIMSMTRKSSSSHVVADSNLPSRRTAATTRTETSEATRSSYQSQLRSVAQEIISNKVKMDKQMLRQKILDNKAKEKQIIASRQRSTLPTVKNPKQSLISMQ